MIPILITFSEAVTVTGTPQLTLETGTNDASVNYATGSGSSILTFYYTVAAGHASSDLDYISNSALALNGGTIKDAAGNNATLTLASPGATGSLAANKALVVDNANPRDQQEAARNEMDPPKKTKLKVQSDKNPGMM